MDIINNKEEAIWIIIVSGIFLESLIENENVDMKWQKQDEMFVDGWEMEGFDYGVTETLCCIYIESGCNKS